MITYTVWGIEIYESYHNICNFHNLLNSSFKLKSVKILIKLIKQIKFFINLINKCKFLRIRMINNYVRLKRKKSFRSKSFRSYKQLGSNIHIIFIKHIFTNLGTKIKTVILIRILHEFYINGYLFLAQFASF